jgi:hypothetical protein
MYVRTAYTYTVLVHSVLELYVVYTTVYKDYSAFMTQLKLKQKGVLVKNEYRYKNIRKI